MIYELCASACNVNILEQVIIHVYWPLFLLDTHTAMERAVVIKLALADSPV